MGSTLTVDNIKDSGDNTLVSSTGSGFKMNFAGLNTSSPVAGDMYYNSTFKKLMIYNGSAWVPVDENEGASNGTAGTGGTETTYTSYKIHTFTSTGNFVCTTHGLVDVLLLGGGGGGGFQAGGGGGAGGFLWYSNFYISAGTYTVTVGTAGTGSTADGVKGTSGGDTSINIASLKTAIGGGGAGSLNTDGGLPGGSGGGGSSGYGGFGQGGGCVPEQGFLGGHSNTHPSIGSSNRAGGGGGGAGGAGMHGWEESSGFGGHGVWAFVGDGASTKALLDNASVGTSSDGFKWIASGGGGGAQADSGSYRKGSGGYGGAGNGGGYSGSGTENNGGNATANTGSGGGGGGRASGSVGIGGNGAAGLVIIRYAS